MYLFERSASFCVLCGYCNIQPEHEKEHWNRFLVDFNGSKTIVENVNFANTVEFILIAICESISLEKQTSGVCPRHTKRFFFFFFVIIQLFFPLWSKIFMGKCLLPFPFCFFTLFYVFKRKQTIHFPSTNQVQFPLFHILPSPEPSSLSTLPHPLPKECKAHCSKEGPRPSILYPG